MTPLSRAACTILDQLTHAIGQVKDSDFVRPVAALGHSTIGQHLRHTLEFFFVLESGVPHGVVNYDTRPHDKVLETHRQIALGAIERIRDFVLHHENDFPLELQVGYQRDTDAPVSIPSCFFRELSYNIEHAVHHMAIMKVGFLEVAPYALLPQSFGIAVSTLRFQDSGPIPAPQG